MSGAPSPRRVAGFDYQDLDRVMHERARLSILSSLASSGFELSFADLKSLCSLTDGNLSRHLHALEQVGIVTTTKDSDSGRSRTMVSLTSSGRKRFLDYVELLEILVHGSARALRLERDSGDDPFSVPEGSVGG